MQFAEINTAGQTNQEPGLDTDFDGVAEGPALTPEFTEYSASIPGGGSFLEIRLTVENLEYTDEDIAFDNLRIEGNGFSTLTVDIDEASIPENGGATSATVTRSTGTSGNATVTLASTDETCSLYGFPYTVGTVTSDLPADLRNAVECANSNSTDDVIDLDGQTATFVSAPSEYALDGHNALQPVSGTGNGALTIQNGVLERDDSLACDGATGDLAEFRFLHLDSDADAFFHGMTFRNGCASDIDPGTENDTKGAAIFNSGSSAVYLSDRMPDRKQRRSAKRTS